MKIARRNINNLRYADDTTLMTETKEELKSFLMKVKEESEKASLKLNIKKLRSWPLVPSATAAAAKSLQSCPTLCDPIDSSPSGSTIPGILQARTLEIDFTYSYSFFINVPMIYPFHPFTFMHWRRKWQPAPVFLPGESQGWWSLMGCRLWGRTESDTTEAT